MKKLLTILFLALPIPALAQNYLATQGSGTTFGSKLVGGVNYPQQTMCDPTTPAQCVAVDASGRVTVLQGTSPWVVNNTQLNGVAFLAGNGVTGTGSQRVTIASDNTAFSVNAIKSGTWNIDSITTLPALVAGSAIIGKVGIDQTTPGTTNATSTAQIGANAVLVGNGVTGTGSQRVTIASDNTPFTVNAAQSTAASLNATVVGTGTFATQATQSGTWTVQPGNTANTTPWLSTISQGGNAAAVKAGSVIPLASDPSLVVSLSPNIGGIAPVVSSALESNHVIKGSSGILISGYVTTGAVQGWLLVSNTTTAPTAGGAAIAPVACIYAPANATTSIGGQGGPAITASTGITLVFSSSGCLTNTASATVFLSGQAL